MILLKDNRGFIALNKRLEIAAIDNKPYGEHSVKIDAKWYANPALPLDLPLQSIFHPGLLFGKTMLKFYIEEMAKERGIEGDLYISIFVGNVEEMDKRYEQEKNAKQ